MPIASSATAVRRGAACVIVHRALPTATVGSATIVRVGDTLRALGDLAHYRRERLAPKVLAITGSNGKTTTKEMVAAILAQGSLAGQSLRGRVLKTEGNFNNLVGLPLTLLRLTKRHKVAVVELGTNSPGEIQRLAEIADPDLGVITTVAAAHLAGLKNLPGVAREKGALYRAVRRERHDRGQSRRSLGAPSGREVCRQKIDLWRRRPAARARRYACALAGAWPSRCTTAANKRGSI